MNNRMLQQLIKKEINLEINKDKTTYIDEVMEE